MLANAHVAPITDERPQAAVVADGAAVEDAPVTQPNAGA